MYKPHALAQNFEQFLKEVQDKEKGSTLKVDTALLSSTDRDQR
jgi:hypothetical protein